MLNEICAEIRNWFALDEDKHVGVFEIKDGTLAPLDFVADGQYFRIVGSKFNDGVYQYPASNLTDESFFGAVWAMRVPQDFIIAAKDIENYAEKYANNAYSSESFGGYSYTMATDENGAPMSWKTRFAKTLNKWRKL